VYNNVVISDKNKLGFSLLEIIVVFVIIALAATLALPKLISMIETARAKEALEAFQFLRSSIERCAYWKAGSYLTCSKMEYLDVDDPATSPNSHFVYTIQTDFEFWVAVSRPPLFRINAIRNVLDGGDGRSGIRYVKEHNGDVAIYGSGVFSSIQRIQQ